MRSKLSWVPGAAVLIVLWAATRAGFDYPASAQANIEGLWQSLGSGALTQDPMGSLLALHIQPPLVNALFAIDVALTPRSHAFLALLNLSAAVATIALLCDALRRCGVGRTPTVVAGIVYALLPGTVLFAFWVYNVTLTGLLAMAAVWGVAALRSNAVAGALVSSLAALGLVLTRSTFVWVLLAAWIAALLWVLARSGRLTRPIAIGVGAVLAAGLGVQLYYTASYGTPSMSSWTGQNIVESQNASGSLSITDAARAEIAADPCQRAVLAAFEERRLNIYDPGGMFNFPECAGIERPAPRGTPAWDAPFKAGTQEINFNQADAVASSKVWTAMALTIVKHDPLQLVRKAVTSPSGSRESGLGRYLGPSENFPWVDEARAALPLATITGILSLFFAPALWALVIIGVFQAWRVRRSQLRQPAFWFATGLLAFHLLATVLMQWAENMRYRAEVDSVLLFAGVLALAAIASRAESST